MDNDPYSTGRIGVFSVCRGQGLRGWIKAFNQTLVIRPKRLLTDVTFKGHHSIDDDHIIYKFEDLDRSEYGHSDGSTCGHGHPLTEGFLEEELEKWEDTNPEKVQWIKHQRHFVDEVVDRVHIHRHHDHDHDDHDHDHDHEDHDEGDLATKQPFDGIDGGAAVGQRRRLLSDTTRYVELAIVNDPGMIAEFDNDYDYIQEKVWCNGLNPF